MCNVYVYVLVHVCVQLCAGAYTEFKHDTHMNHAPHITTMAKYILYISSPIKRTCFVTSRTISPCCQKAKDVHVVVIQARLTKLTHGDNKFFISLLFVLIQALILEKGLIT